LTHLQVLHHLPFRFLYGVADQKETRGGSVSHLAQFQEKAKAVLASLI
jgi:hypothetical protein